MEKAETVIVVSGGSASPARAGPGPGAAAVIAADAGLDLAHALGLRPELVVGDLDSVSVAGLAAAERDGTRIVRHPVDKDATDLELALDQAALLEPGRLLVVGGDGGRLDHLLASLLVLGSERYAAFEVDALLGPARAHVVRGERELAGEPGGLVSLLALHGPAEGVVTEGLAYPLRGETLEAGSSRGVSNRFEAATARVTVGRGVVLAVCPGAET